MDFTKYKHRAVFTATASVLPFSEEHRNVAKASLTPLKSMLPAGIDPENDGDLLYIACNGAVAGLCNKNGDAVSNETALAIHRTAKNKYISTEHDKDKVVGFILEPGLTKYGTNEPISDAEAAALTEPFNMAFAGVVWKAINPMLAKYLIKQGDSTNKDALSMSWEILFNDYEIGVGSRNVFEAKVVKAEDPTFSTYDKMLRGNGGTGRDAKGQEVYRIISSDALILGYSIVPNPAAEVKGIAPIESINVEVGVASNLSTTTVSSELESIIRDTVAKEVEAFVKSSRANTGLNTISPKSEEKNINHSNVSVNLITAKSMKIESVEQLMSALGTHEASAAVVDFVKAIKDASAKFEQEVKAKEDLVNKAEAAKLENEERAKKLQASVEKLEQELNEVRAAQQAAEENQRFQERMASFDEKYNLDDEDRNLIASDIKGLDDAAFESYAKKQEKLMAGKKKASKEEKKEMKEEKTEKTEEKCEASVKEALASVTEEKSEKVPNGVTVDEDLKAKMQKAFGASFKINGKSVEERVAAKKKK